METWNQITSPGGIVALSFILTLLFAVAVYIYHFFRDRKLIKSVTSFKRGTKSERDLVLRLRQKGIPAVTLFHDVVIETRIGKYSQIDLVMATTEGIIVFEVKDFLSEMPE